MGIRPFLIITKKPSRALLIYSDPLRHPIRGRGKGAGAIRRNLRGPLFSRVGQKGRGAHIPANQRLLFFGAFLRISSRLVEDDRSGEFEPRRTSSPRGTIRNTWRTGWAPAIGARGTEDNIVSAHALRNCRRIRKRKTRISPLLLRGGYAFFFYFSILFEARRKRVGEKAATPASRAPDMRTYLFLYLTFLNIREEMRSSYLQHPRFKSPKAL